MSSSSNQVIARLTPANFAAKRAYNDVAGSILDNTTNACPFSHAARYMIIKTWTGEPTHAQPVVDDQSGLDCSGTEHGETEAETDHEGFRPGNSPADPMRFDGYFQLSFGVPPSLPPLGWFIGIGRWNAKGAKPNGGVDLQLALPNSKYEVAGRHARLFFDRAGGLVVRVVSDRSPVVVLGSEEFTAGQRVITQARTRISFGSLAYLFEFAVTDEEQYQRNLRKFFKEHLGFQPPAPDLSATPSPWDTKLGDWLVRGTVGRGASATVSAAKHMVTGVAGAAKFFVRTQDSFPAIAKEIELLKSLPIHPQILQFCEVQYERREPWFTGPADKDDERYHFKARPERVAIIYTPFARTTFAEFTPPQAVHLAAFYQVLQGIHALHTNAIVHRDIKPSNIGIVDSSADQIHVIILDYGHSIRATTCDPFPGSVGTVPFLAPEMEITSYDQGVDIWACGIFGLTLFVTNGGLKWQNVVHGKDQYNTVLKGLREKSTAHVENLLSRMLAWNPMERINAKDALNHICFSGFQGEDVTSASTLRQKRSRS